MLRTGTVFFCADQLNGFMHVIFMTGKSPDVYIISIIQKNQYYAMNRKILRYPRSFTRQLMKGASSVFNIAGTFIPHRVTLINQHDDSKALAGDWKAAGLHFNMPGRHTAAKPCYEHKGT
jgi:hypothetical protein